MIDLEKCEILDEAKSTFAAGDRERALALAHQYAIAVIPDLYTASPEELPEILGVLSRLYVKMEEWELAALKYADLCSYTEKYFPGTEYTASDWWRLSWYRKNSGDVHGALDALDRAALHMSQTDRWPSLQRTYKEERSALQKMAASAAGAAE
jgi:hypothetical protein